MDLSHSDGLPHNRLETRQRQPRSSRLRFDLVETCGIALMLAGALTTVALYSLHPQPTPAPPMPNEALWFAEKYGPSRNSQFYEEWLIRDYFQDRRGGTFVDVGAADYKTWSNTYYLETTLGWSGIAVEPQRAFEAAYRQHRPRTKFLSFFVSDTSHQEQTVFGNPTIPWVTSATREFTQRWGQSVEVMSVPTATLTDLLAAQGIDRFDFLNMDIELSEPKALAGFDLSRFRPSLVCIEAQPEVRQQILDYFTESEYVVVGKYLRVDTQNLYFAPFSRP
jgi:FkbM family methyltransferase